MEEILKLLAENPEIVASIVNRYKPALYETGNQFLDMYEDLINNERYYDLFAKSKKNTYNALLQNGFTENQAMQILLADIKNTAEFASKAANTSANINSNN